MTKNITWFELKTIIPVIILVASITLTYGMLLVRVSVIETKIDLVLANQETITATLVKQEAADVAMEIRITALETINGLKK